MVNQVSDIVENSPRLQRVPNVRSAWEWVISLQIAKVRGQPAPSFLCLSVREADESLREYIDNTLYDPLALRSSSIRNSLPN